MRKIFDPRRGLFDSDPAGGGAALGRYAAPGARSDARDLRRPAVGRRAVPLDPFFDAFHPERLRELFGRLGGRLSRVEEIDRDAPGLVCNLLRVRVIHDAQGRVKPLILGFAGRETCEQLKIGR